MIDNTFTKEELDVIDAAMDYFNDHDAFSPEQAPVVESVLLKLMKSGSDCPLCAKPLEGEQHFHQACADEEQARADYTERAIDEQIVRADLEVLGEDTSWTEPRESDG